MRSIVFGFVFFIFLTGCSVKVYEAKTSMNGEVPERGLSLTVPTGGTIYHQYDYYGNFAARITTDSHYMLRKGDMCLAYKYSNEGLMYCKKPYCFRDTDNDGKFDVHSNFNGVKRTRRMGAMPPMEYEIVKEPSINAQGFSRELVYQGFANGVVNIVYREYKDNFARPAFFQNIQYEIKAFPTTIVFQDISLEIINAESNSITYKVKN